MLLWIPAFQLDGPPAKIKFSVLFSSETSSTRKIIEREWHKFFAREVLFGRFKERNLNYFSEAFRVCWTK